MVETNSNPNDLLRHQRELRGWSQGKVADMLHLLGGVADSKLVGKWERGVVKPSPYYREKLCLLYGVPADQLGFINLPDDKQHITLMPLQGRQLELGDVMANRFDPNRRLLLQMLGVTGMSATIIPDILNSDLWSRLALAAVKPTYIDEQALSHIEKLNEVCFNLSNNNQLEIVEQILPTYLPQITALANQSSNWQAKAASLASRGFILAAEIDKKNVTAMQTYTQQAVFYSQLSQDSNIQADALRVEATIALVAKQPFKTLFTYQKALPLVDQVSPLLRSRIYLGLASAYARCGQKQDALRYLGLAQEHFPAQPEEDPNFLYMCMSASRPALHLYEALTFSDLKQPNDTWKALMQVNGIQPRMSVTESTRIEFINLQAKTAAMLGNMDESCTYLQTAIEAADKAGYSVWREEAAEVYQEMMKLWPHELQVRRLGKLFQKGA